jgi:hypothetical protein
MNAAGDEAFMLLAVLPITYLLADCILVLLAQLLILKLQWFHQHLRNPRNH